MPARVLVVDDHPDVLQTLLRFLSFGEYQTVGLTCFAQAKRYIEREQPDILVTDVRLGAFNGLQLALCLRTRHPAAGIVVLSAWDDPTLREQTARLGARYHLKPLTKTQLLDAVSASLNPASDEIRREASAGPLPA
jgi:two-component system response regulator YesN